MSDIDVLFEQIPVKGGMLGRITLNRPDQINVLSTQMCQQVYQQLQAWQDDTGVVAVILRGAGERGFCAGGDLKEIYQHGFDNPQGGQTFFWHEYRLNHIIYHYPKPIICLLHGVVMGGGVGISLYAQYRIAADNLCWAMPEVKIGLFPDAGGNYYDVYLTKEAILRQKEDIERHKKALNEKTFYLTMTFLILNGDQITLSSRNKLTLLQLNAVLTVTQEL